MKQILMIFPVALLVAYSQIVVKWHTNSQQDTLQLTILERLLNFCMDPIVVSGYCAALIASFWWLFIVGKLELMVAFPIYIGLTFLFVLLGSNVFLAESLSVPKAVAVLLIFSGITLGVLADA